MRGCSTAQKRKEEACKANGSRFLPFQLEHDRIELRSREEGENDRAYAGEKLNPGFVCPEHSRADRRANETFQRCTFKPVFEVDDAGRAAEANKDCEDAFETERLDEVCNEGKRDGKDDAYDYYI